MSGEAKGLLHGFFKIESGFLFTVDYELEFRVDHRRH